MPFTITKNEDTPVLKMASFRFPELLLAELKEIAEQEGISQTELIRQMLHYCVEEYNTSRSSRRVRKEKRQ